MKNLASAFIKAQKEMAPLLKDKKGVYGNYSTLASVQEVCLPALGNHGIAVFQSVFTDWEDGRVYVRVSCTLYHAESGENWVDDVSLVPTKTDPQGIGSAITYARRYILMTMAGIAPEDDDGTAASGGKVEAPQRANAQRQPPPRLPVAVNGNVSEQVTDAELAINKIIAGWTSPRDAMAWATDGKLTENEHSARTRWAQIVKNDFGDTCNQTNLRNIMRAYAAHYLNKQAEPAKETA